MDAVYPACFILLQLCLPGLMLGCTGFAGTKDRRLRDHVVFLHTSKELLRQGCVWQGQSLKGGPQRPWDEAVIVKPEL